MKRVALLIITGTLFVFSTEEKPSVKLQPETVTVQEGENVTLFCNSSGSSLTITWKFNGSNVTTSDSRISFSVDNRNLIITNVSRGNEGEYKCVARNNVGNDTSNTAFVLVELNRPRRPPSFGPPPIRVSEVPDPPHSLTIDSKSSRVVIISWTADLYGISASENYTVEISQYNQNFMDAVCQGSLSSSACVVSSYSTKASLTGLLPWTTYNIRVFATNEIGKSNSSDILNVTTDEEEPSAPPLNVRGHNISSTSILVVWGEVPTAYRNGIITSYNITYYSQTENHSNSTRVDHPVLQVTLLGLKEFVNYSITVLASTVKGNGPKSDPIIVSTGEDEPSAGPVNVRGHNKNSTSIILEWNDVPVYERNGIITSYNITYQSLTEDDSNSTTVDFPGRQVTLIGLREYVNYSITVSASTKIGPGPASDPIIISTGEDKPSAPPADIRGHNTSSTSILVQWGEVPPADQNGVILTYTISYQSLTQNDKGRKKVASSIQKLNLTDLRKFVNYNITLFASTVMGNGKPSDPIFVVTDQDKPTAAPLNVRGHNISSTGILIEWGDVPAFDKNGIITSYSIKYQSQTENHHGSAVAGPNDREIELKGLKEYVHYDITVLASTSKGDGPDSSLILVSTDQNKPSDSPLNVRGHNTSSTSILVKWDDVPAFHQNGIITSYKITYWSQTEGHNGSAIAGPYDRQKELTDLREYVDYDFTVRASNSKGDGPDSSPAIVVRTDQDRPSAAPQNLRSINTTSTSIFVMWDEVLPDEQNGIIIRFNVSYRAIPLAGSAGPIYSIIVKAPAREVYLTGLTKDMYYNISVLASTIKGDGIYSSPKTFRTREDRPGAPPQNVQGYNTSSTSINVTWNEVLEEKQHGDIIRYTVMYKKMGNLTYESVKVISRNFVKLRRLNKFTFYDIKVSASTRVGNGPASNPIKVQTDEDVPSAGPELVSVQTLNSTSIQIEWLAVPEESIYGIPTRYTIYYANSDGKVYTKVVTPVNVQNTYQEVVSGLKESTEYSFQVSLSTAKGEGPLSVSKSSATKGGCCNEISTDLREERFSRSSYDRTGYQISLPTDWALIELNKLDNMIFAMLQMKQK